MRLVLPVVVLFALAVSGCGRSVQSFVPSPKEQLTGDERVIRDWSRDLSRGDEAAAAARFAIPAVVANGTEPVRVATRELVLAFHRSLPCGAVLVAAEAHHGLTVARFRLTDRPGGACGAGVGGYAATAFEIRDGRIVRWLRVDDPGPRTPPGPVV